MSKRPAEDQLAPVPAKGPRENGTQEDGQARTAPGRRREGKLPLIIYRDAEPLAGLQGYWRNANGQDVELEVLIAPEFLAKDNKRVKSRQIWGDLVYTADSDLVAVLMHLGYYTSTLAHAPQAVVEARAIIKLQDSCDFYPSKQRFVKSRTWSRPTENCAYTVEKFWLVTRSGCVVEMQPSVNALPAPTPTVQPQSSDRYITTRNTGSKGKQSQDVSVQYNLVNEPWLKYTLAAIADKGLKPSQLTSSRLLDQVLFLETASQRYQITRISTASCDEPGAKEVYSFSRCKTPLPASTMRRLGVPLPAASVDVLETSVEWEEFKWGVSQLHLKGKEYPLKRVHLMRICKSEEGGAAA